MNNDSFCYARLLRRLRLCPLLAVIAFLALIAKGAMAGSATWDLNPTTNDWNTAANWTPQTVPDQSTDVATFDASNVSTVSVGTYFSLDSIVFNPGASAYTFIISENPSGDITFSGAGIINNSGVTQSFQTFNGVDFAGTATAGNDVVFINQDNGNAFWLWIPFNDHSTAGSATFINGGNSSGFLEGVINFNNFSSAADSTIINEAGDTIGGVVDFFDLSTAGNSTITSYRNGVTAFFTSSTAGTATLIADGGHIRFENSTDGQMARVELTNGGLLDLASHHGTEAMSIGSLEGDSTGVVRLGTLQLTVGGNGLSTTFGGVLTGNPGALTKAGNETLTLTGASTYAGLTTVTGGALLAAAATGSPTGAGPVHVDAGTFGGTGSVTGGVTVGTGTGPHAFLAPGVKGPGTLSIANTLTFKSNSGYKCELAATPHPRVDQVSANGITIENGAWFMLRTKGNQTLPMGTVFTVIDNTATTPITGMFANLPDGSTFTVGNNTFQVSYEGGDGNDLTLTVVP
jgi:autotransporter-associated beta strand protein